MGNIRQALRPGVVAALLALMIILGVSAEAGAVVGRYSDLLLKGPWIDPRAYGSFAAAHADAASRGGEIHLWQDVTITADMTISASIVVHKGAKINHGVYNIHHTGNVTAGIYQIYNGTTGTVTGLKESYPEWFGPGTLAVQKSFLAGGAVHLTASYTVSGPLVTSAATTKVYGDNPYLVVLTKAFNGDLISSGEGTNATNGIEFTGFGIEGDGAHYSGGGIRATGYNTYIHHVRINDTLDSAVIFDPAVTTNAGSGTYATVKDSFLKPTNYATTYMIRSAGASASTRPTGYDLSHLGGGGLGPDFSGMNDVSFTNSLVTGFKFDENCSKVKVYGNRITDTTQDITITGQNHAIDANDWGFGEPYKLYLSATALGVHFGPLNNITEGASSFKSINFLASWGSSDFNEIFTQREAYPFSWTGSVGNPTVGTGGSGLAYFKRSGRKCWVSITAIIGSDPAAGSGTYIFALPFKSYGSVVGTAIIKPASGNYYIGAFVTDSAASTARIYLPGAAAALAAGDLTLGEGSAIQLTVEYLVSPT